MPYGCREGVCGTCEAFLKQPNGMKNDVRVCSCVWAFVCMHIVHILYIHTSKHGLVLEIMREYIYIFKRVCMHLHVVVLIYMFVYIVAPKIQNDVCDMIRVYVYILYV